MFGFGHPSEHLIWAPDPRDDLAFTMYVMEEEEHRDEEKESNDSNSNENF